MIPLEFDFQACLAEALSLVDKFVAHRNYDKKSNEHRWKSLCIQGLNGDSTKTLYHSDYNIKQPVFALTEIAQHCPKTVAFLETMTDLKKCGRIRFMLLEPGGRIHVHRDSADGELTIGINIALNNPVGCDFHIDVDEDGRHGEWTKTIPFEPGSMAAIDIGRFHYVENNSDQPRIHIILDGPIKVSHEKIEALARTQNKVNDDNELALALLLKRASYKNSENHSENQFEFVRTQMLDREFLRKHFELFVLDEELQDKQLNSEMINMTVASIYPLRFTICKKNVLDYMIQTKATKNTKAILIICAGTLIEKISEFVFEVFRTLSKMRSENAYLAGHIMNRREQKSLLLHQQMTIIDLVNFNYLRLGHFGFPKNAGFRVPDFEVSVENIHDDYTPLWLKKSKTNGAIEVNLNWGTLLIAQSLSLSRPVINFSESMRKTRLYSYPEKSQSSELKLNRIAVKAKVSNAATKAYLFNNENLGVLQLENFKPDYLYAVSSAFKPASLIHQYWPDGQPKKIFMIDYSQPALDYVKQLSRCRSMVEVVTVIFNNSKRERKIVDMKTSDIRIKLDEIIAQQFNKSEQLFLNSLKKLSFANFSHLDLFSNFEKLLPSFDRRGKFIFWHSNVWSNDILNFIYSKSEMENTYRKFVLSIARKYQMKAWKHRDYNEVFIGNSLSDITGFITAGLLEKKPDPKLIELIFEPQPKTQIKFEAKKFVDPMASL